MKKHGEVTITLYNAACTYGILNMKKEAIATSSGRSGPDTEIPNGPLVIATSPVSTTILSSSASSKSTSERTSHLGTRTRQRCG